MQNKILFLTFVTINEANGISKKVFSQVKSLQSYGNIVALGYVKYEADYIKYIIDKEVILQLPNSNYGTFKLLCFVFKPILSYLRENKFTGIYLRYNLSGNYFMYKFLKNNKKDNRKCLIEIPTYPYDGEITSKSIISKIKIWIDRLTRGKIGGIADGIVTFSEDEYIWRTKTIKISNAVDPKQIALWQPPQLSQEFHLIGVAVLAPWHGFDRVIKGIYTYNKSNPKYKIIFHIVGGDMTNKTFVELKKMAEEYCLMDNIIFHGPLSGVNLDLIFNKSHIAIGSLGRHRNSIDSMRSLKNIEYATRGIPFVYSENNPDFDNARYVYKASQNDNPIDIPEIINFRAKVTMSPKEIRESVKSLTWENQMHKIHNAFRGI